MGSLCAKILRISQADPLVALRLGGSNPCTLPSFSILQADTLSRMGFLTQLKWKMVGIDAEMTSRVTIREKLSKRVVLKEKGFRWVCLVKPCSIIFLDPPNMRTWAQVAYRYLITHCSTVQWAWPGLDKNWLKCCTTNATSMCMPITAYMMDLTAVK